MYIKNRELLEALSDFSSLLKISKTNNIYDEVTEALLHVVDLYIKDQFPILLEKYIKDFKINFATSFDGKEVSSSPIGDYVREIVLKQLGGK